MTMLARSDVRALQAAAIGQPVLGDGSEVLDLLRWRRGGYEGGVALSFNR